ncbi:lipocalin [Frigidibacter albus]|uniref:Lipocalin n=1 Tax=Frigidibacter albus TaxID=1465486 RepID=A0A6L8VKQ8_9RHOB|nr:lipocalin family protein [Frigidibacter albus]MZQ89959.1 lipocalin [Frigidibacter albus]NBE31666.1 lipocalin [Frigidibacter albus]GGH55787.1 lipocalin [Frigidibacter albus]
MHRVILRAALALLLAGCAAPGPGPGSRDPGAMIASAALFDPARFAGPWHVVADFPAPGASGCGITREDWRLTAPGRFAVSGAACGPRGRTGFAGTAAVVGPGRIDLSAGNTRPDLGGEPLWVLWIDADYRVAALGTPSGRFGMMLSREPAARGDLYTAAREVLDFNGYALERLRPR